MTKSDTIKMRYLIKALVLLSKNLGLQTLPQKQKDEFKKLCDERLTVLLADFSLESEEDESDE